MTTIKGKLIPLALITCLIGGLLAGCNDSGAETGTANESGDADSPSTGNADDPLSKAYAEQIFQKTLDETVTPDYFKNTPAYEYTIQLGDSVTNDETFGQRYFEKKFNVKLKVIRLDGGDRIEQLNLMYATGTIPDLVAGTLNLVPEYAKQGLLAEIPEDMLKEHMPEYYNTLQTYDPGLLSVARVDGKNMGLPRFYPNGGVPRPAAIRADWLENVGITKLPETLDELEAAFLKFRNEDPDGNGVKDTYALSNPSDYDGQYWFQSIFGAFGANPFMWVERDGKLQFGLTTEEAKQALKRLHSWYEQELIDPEFITDLGRSVDQEDVAAKFAKHKIGYMDHVSFDDYQWDYDGHVNYKWVTNTPEWKQWFDERQGNPEEFYSKTVDVDFSDHPVAPYYILLPPVKGPNGQAGYQRQGYQETILLFGKPLEEDPGKYEKLLKIMEFLHTDEETYKMLEAGPEGVLLVKDADGELIYNPKWNEHELYDAQLANVGLEWKVNPMRWTNPDWLAIVGGARPKQRYEKTADVVRDRAFYENKLKVSLPSQATYSELLDTRVKEYVIKTIAGDIDIDSTFDDMVARWYQDGGEQLTKEANDWYESAK
ncbi:extracellular solute-binding protein [Paenibacillus antri]|uniref:Extracellular solute-binding protein n=1 Tax=Paenibacillus antri TaxID=2582848 RepID=A0A5R9GFB6_9BACL|nr:extracellular solute-binding protein [Paenibacillus antri]TLS53869.1 extracellular solute-binding protein [Paenibacillus antri]